MTALTPDLQRQFEDPVVAVQPGALGVELLRFRVAQAEHALGNGGLLQSSSSHHFRQIQSGRGLGLLRHRPAVVVLLEIPDLPGDLPQGTMDFPLQSQQLAVRGQVLQR